MSLILKLYTYVLIFQSVICAIEQPVGNLNIAGIFENIQLHQTAFTYSNDVYNNGKAQKDAKVYQIVDPNIQRDEPFTALKGTCTFLRQSIVGLFGPQSSLNFDIVQAITERKDIPHILTRWVDPSQMGFQTVNFFPNPEKLASGFLDIINALEWESFTILYTDPENLLQINEFIRQAKDDGIIVYMENVNPVKNGDFRPSLRNAGRSGQKNFVIDCPIRDLKNLLMQLQQVGLLTAEYNYFLSNLDAHTEDLTQFQYSDAVITGVHLILPKDKMAITASKALCEMYNMTFKLECGKPELDIETALIIDSFNVFLQTLNSLGITRGQYLDCDNDEGWPEGLNVINTLKSSHFEGVTGPIEFDKDGFRSTFQLTIYQIRDAFYIRGSWNTTDGLSEDIQLSFIEEEDEEDTLRGAKLKVLISLTEPYAQLIETDVPLKGNDRFEGFTIDLIEEISLLEGFDYTFSVREDHLHGYFDSRSGKWTGMIGDIIEGKADIAVADLTITKDRVGPVEFTQPFMSVGIGILFRKPYEVLPGFFNFAQPFSISFWQYLGISYLIMVFSVFIIGRISPGQWERANTCKESKKYLVNELTLLNSLWFVAAGLFRQTTNVKVSSIPAKFIAITWYIYCFVLFAMYISYSLTRNAVVEKEELFEDVEGLLEYAEENGITFGAKNGGSTASFFKNSISPIYQQVATYMEEHPEDMVNTIEEGIKRANNGDYAFFMESATIDYTTERNCKLASYGELLDSKGFGIALKKGSPLLGPINKAIIKLRASGTLLRLKKKWWEEKRGGDACVTEESVGMIPKTVYDIRGLVYFTFFGMVVALVSAFFEFTVYVIRLSKRIKVSFGKTFGQEFRKCFGRHHTVQNVEAIALTKQENENGSNKENA